jgi:hypothetical protein
MDERGRMDESESFDTAQGRSTMFATVATLAAVVGIVYLMDRRYSRWERRLRTEISPLTRSRARVARMRAGYRDRRAAVDDLAWVISAVMDEVAS